MSLKAQIIRTALESVETPVAPIVEQPVAEDVFVEPQHDYVDQGVNQVDPAAAAITQMDAALESLESLHALVIDAQKHKAFTSVCQDFAHITLKTIHNDLGISFESSQDNTNTISLETIVDAIKRLWEMIKAALMKAAEFLSDVFEKIFGETVRLENEAKAVKKAAENTDGAVKNTYLPISQASLVRYIQDVRDPVTALAMLNTMVHQAVGYDHASSKVLSNASSKLRDVLWGNADPFELTETPPPALFKNRVTEVEAGLAMLETDVLPGGKIFFMQAPRQGDSWKYFRTWQKEGRNLKFLVGAKNAKDFRIAPTLGCDVLTLPQIENLATHVIELAASVRAARSVVDEANKRAKSLKDTFPKDSLGQTSANTLWFKYYQARVAGNGKATLLISSHALAVANAYLTYAKLSLKRYSSD